MTSAQVLGTQVALEPRALLKLFVVLVAAILVVMAALGAAKWIKNKAMMAKNQAAASTGLGQAPSDVFEVEA